MTETPQAEQRHLFDADNPAATETLRTLVVCPRHNIRDRIKAQRPPGNQFEFVQSGAAALLEISRNQFVFLVLDRCLPDLDGQELLQMIRQSNPELNIVSLDSSGESLRTEIIHGQHPNIESLASLFSTLDASPKARYEPGPMGSSFPARAGFHSIQLPGRLSNDELLPEIIGTSPCMALVGRLVRLVAPRTTTVLITGETGTGKECIAKAVHELSPRRRNPFIVVNCGAIPESLFEAELFGFERGAFTGAQQSRMGKIQAARGGTLFLDEVGEMPLALQAKLLRFLQEHEVQRLGSHESIKVDVRIIAATNADIGDMVQAGKFRGDLFYRLSVFPIALPSLRHRREDIGSLALHFLERLCREAGVPPKRFAAQALQNLKSHDWPGNVRELEHAIERAFIFAEAGSEVHIGLSHPDAPSDTHSVSASLSRIQPHRTEQINERPVPQPGPRAIRASSL